MIALSSSVVPFASVVSAAVFSMEKCSSMAQNTLTGSTRSAMPHALSIGKVCVSSIEVRL